MGKYNTFEPVDQPIAHQLLWTVCSNPSKPVSITSWDLSRLENGRNIASDVLAFAVEVATGFSVARRDVVFPVGALERWMSNSGLETVLNMCGSEFLAALATAEVVSTTCNVEGEHFWQASTILKTGQVVFTDSNYGGRKEYHTKSIAAFTTMLDAVLSRSMCGRRVVRHGYGTYAEAGQQAAGQRDCALRAACAIGDVAAAASSGDLSNLSRVVYRPMRTDLRRRLCEHVWDIIHRRGHVEPMCVSDVYQPAEETGSSNLVLASAVRALASSTQSVADTRASRATVRCRLCWLLLGVIVTTDLVSDTHLCVCVCCRQ